MRTIIGRVSEQKSLMKYYNSNKSEFIAIFGRRRVGKTFLVKSLFENEFIFYAVGIQGGDTKKQIQNFNEEVINFGGFGCKKAENWHEAFDNLRNLLNQSHKNAKKIIFLDEVSWMSTPDSEFLSALDHFWNRWISSRTDVLLIICGSATSWIVDNIINNTGGLHNRLTGQIYLAPFTLKECEDLLIEKKIIMPRYQILESYMVFGGIPFYLDFFESDRSLAQNIDRIYFAPNALLKDEYDNLYRALFKYSDNHIRIVEALAEKKKGLTRSVLSEKSQIKGGGTLTKTITELISCGFIREYLAFGKKSRDRLYQLIDPFTLFHLTFSDKQKRYTHDYWLHYSVTPAYSAWSGYAFELACLLHVNQIKRSLGISGVLTEVSSWRSTIEKPGTQIDLVLDRSDKIINLCEMKFASDVYSINKEYSKKLRERKLTFINETKTKKAAHITMVTTYGLAANVYSAEIPFQLTLDDLFREP
jgi:AAA+ ATPase superfamily predicted ATPase